MKTSENDLKQFQVMSDCLAQFKSGTMSLRQLIANIEALIGMLDSSDKAARGELSAQWEILEQVYSYAEAMRDGHIDSQGDEQISGAIATLDSQLKMWAS